MIRGMCHGDLTLHNCRKWQSVVCQFSSLMLELEAHRTGSQKGCRVGKKRNKLEPRGMSWSPQGHIKISVLASDLDDVGRPFIREAEGRARDGGAVGGADVESHWEGEPAGKLQCVWATKWLLLHSGPPYLAQGCVAHPNWKQREGSPGKCSSV